MPTLATTPDIYCYRLEFHDADQAPVYSQPLAAADFHRAISATYFTAFRDGVVDDFSPNWETARIEPRFAQKDGSALSEGFRVIAPLSMGDCVTCNFGVGYFSARAARLRAAIIRDRDWPADRSLYYTLAAYLDDGAEPPRSAPFTLESASLSVPLRRQPVAAWGRLQPWDEPQPSQMPIIVGRSLLEDACEEASQHPGREIGGLILGDLNRDPETVRHDSSGAYVRAALADLTEAPPAGQEAVAEFLCRAHHALRFVRAEIDDRSAWLASHAAADRLESDLAHGLRALSVGVRLLVREAQALVRPDVAEAYLKNVVSL